MTEGVRARIEAALWARVTDIPDWPQPGVLFRDLTPLLSHADTFTAAVDLMAVEIGRGRIDEVVGIEARGFPYGAALAYHLGVGFVTLRKAGKLPGPVDSISYDLEYGTAALELPHDVVRPGRSIAIVDDVLATGGTACAAVELVRRSGAEVSCVAVIMELADLGGAQRVRDMGVEVISLLTAP